MGGGDGLGFIEGMIMVFVYMLIVIGIFCSFIFIPILKLLKTQLRNNQRFFYFSKTFCFYMVCCLALCVGSFITTIMLGIIMPPREKLEFGFLALMGYFQIHLFVIAIVVSSVPTLAIYFLIKFRSLKKISFDIKDSFKISKKEKFLLSLKVFVISTILFMISFFVYFAVIIGVLFLIGFIVDNISKAR